MSADPSLCPECGGSFDLMDDDQGRVCADCEHEGPPDPSLCPGCNEPAHVTESDSDGFHAGCRPGVGRELYAALAALLADAETSRNVLAMIAKGKAGATLAALRLSDIELSPNGDAYQSALAALSRADGQER